PRHFALGLVCAASISSMAVHAQGLRSPASGELTRALSPPGQPVAAASAAGGLRSADYIVATVTSEPVTNNEVRARMQRVVQAMQAQGAQQLPATEELAREVLERLIVEKAPVQSAKERGIKVHDYAVDQALENMARQNGLTPEAMRQEILK